ncbi:hypothetical protein AAHH80_40645, partial [Burkholderia pseudomallei]
RQHDDSKNPQPAPIQHKLSQRTANLRKTETPTHQHEKSKIADDYSKVSNIATQDFDSDIGKTKKQTLPTADTTTVDS